jgi:hypothetical protein
MRILYVKNDLYMDFFTIFALDKVAGLRQLKSINS